MSERKRLLFLILILSVISLSISSITIGILYRTAFEENRVMLINIAQSRARMIEAMAQYDKEKADMITDEDPEHDPFTATLSQINEAHKKFEGFGETGEFTLAQHTEDNIVFLLRHRHANLAAPHLIPFHSTLAEPMRLALSGKSGTIVSFDYRGEMVLAAYEPVAVLNLGIVAKIDLQEVRSPFISAGIIAICISILLVFLSAFLFVRVTNPMIKKIISSESRYRRLFESAKDGILILDAETGMIVDVNPFLVDLLGFSSEHFLNKSIWDIGFLSGIISNKQKFAELTQKKYVRYENLPLETSDGQAINIEFISNVYKVDAQKVIQCNIRDITERKQAEQVLAKNLQSLNLGESLAGLGYFERNWQTDEGYWSLGFYKLLGESPEEVDCKHAEFMKYIHLDDRERVSNHIRESIEKRNGMDIEFRIVQANGNILEIHGKGKNFYDSTRKPVNTIGTFWDITDRKKADKELKESEENYQQVVSNITTAVWKADIGKDGNFENTYTSPVYDELLGLTSDGSTDNWSKHLTYVKPEHMERVNAAFRDAIKSPGKVID
ncbi:MAG: PAS domain S-box protein, partial [Calditrichaeota bacterium]|nr:PAS domain S-box protein [Calditrichota bacterium]